MVWGIHLSTISVLDGYAKSVIEANNGAELYLYGTEVYGNNVTSDYGLISAIGDSKINIASASIRDNFARSAILYASGSIAGNMAIEISTTSIANNDAGYGVIYIKGAKKFTMMNVDFTENIKSTMSVAYEKDTKMNMEGRKSAAALTIKNVDDFAFVTIGTISFVGNENRTDSEFA
jgi:hypothetical protein